MCSKFLLHVALITWNQVHWSTVSMALPSKSISKEQSADSLLTAIWFHRSWIVLEHLLSRLLFSLFSVRMTRVQGQSRSVQHTLFCRLSPKPSIYFHFLDSCQIVYALSMDFLQHLQLNINLYKDKCWRCSAITFIGSLTSLKIYKGVVKGFQSLCK